MVIMFKLDWLMLLVKFSVAAAKDFKLKINILNPMLDSGRTGYSCQWVTNCSLNEFNFSGYKHKMECKIVAVAHYSKEIVKGSIIK